MTELVRPVGLGLASRGSVDDVLEWAQQARRKGLHSIWFHDSLYERDAVTYAAAIASHVPDIRVALGAGRMRLEQHAQIRENLVDADRGLAHRLLAHETQVTP